MATSMIKCNDAVEKVSYSGITAYRSGRVVTLVISATATSSAAGWKIIDTIGERFRPPLETYFVGYNNSDKSSNNSRPLMMDVMPTGDVRVYLFSDKLTVAPRATVTYIVTT